MGLYLVTDTITGEQALYEAGDPRGASNRASCERFAAVKIGNVLEAATLAKTLPIYPLGRTETPAASTPAGEPDGGIDTSAELPPSGDEHDTPAPVSPHGRAGVGAALDPSHSDAAPKRLFERMADAAQELKDDKK